MVTVYDGDFDDVQGQLAVALRVSDQAQTQASTYWKALKTLRAALDATPDEDDDGRRLLREMSQQLQQAHQAAQHRAHQAAGEVARLTPLLARLADDEIARDVA